MKIFQVGFHKQSEILSCHFGAEKDINTQPKNAINLNTDHVQKLVYVYICAYIYVYVCVCIYIYLYTVYAELLQSNSLRPYGL